MTTNPNDSLNLSKTPDEGNVPPAPYSGPVYNGAPVYNAPPTPEQTPPAYSNQPYQGYTQNVYTTPQNRYNVFSLVSFIAGLSQIVLAWIFGPLVGVAAIVFGHLSLKQIKQTNEQGYMFALVGLITGYLGVGISVLFFLFFVLIAVTSS